MTRARQARFALVAVEALAELLRAKVEIRVLADPRLLRRLGAPSPTSANGEGAMQAGAQDVGRVVAGVARRLPWESTCLAQALAAQRMLARRRLANELHLGVATGGELTAHAWITSAGSAVLGEPGDHTAVVALTRAPR